MKPIVLAAALVLLAGPALAQSMTETKTTTTTTIAPAQETEMQAYITHEHPVAIAPPSGFTVTTGAVVPQTIELNTFPAERHWSYDYATIGDRTVLVDPNTRTIIHVFH
ncbi:MAG: DUF1236 domain-containing protein [Stellaceae bacterium]